MLKKLNLLSIAPKKHALYLCQFDSLFLICIKYIQKNQKQFFLESIKYFIFCIINFNIFCSYFFFCNILNRSTEGVFFLL